MAPTPLAQNYTVVAQAPPGLITDDPALLRLPSGRLLATYTFRFVADPRQENPQRFRLAHSDDEGGTWTELAPLEINMGQPLLHDGRLFLLGNRLGRKDIIILASDDEGITWTPPVTLFEGLYWNAPTATAVHRGALYRPFNAGSYDQRWAFGGVVVVRGDLSRDLMDPAAWRISPEVSYPETPSELVPARYPEHWKDHWLEPNAVVVGDRVRILVRPRMDGYATSGMCAVCDLSDEDGAMDLRFTQFHPFPGGQNKFYIDWDPVSRLFWMAVNLPTDTQDVRGREPALKASRFAGRPGNERRFLFLQYSVDALNWFSAGCVAYWPSPLQAFHYTAQLITGDDMLILSRTSRNSHNQHDSELVTLHRIKDFRALAYDLYGTPVPGA